MRAKWPSLGFVAVCLTYLLVAAFFLWGFSAPDLDRVWTLDHELKTGRLSRLRAVDRELMRTAMERHPGLAEAILDGRAIGIVSEHNDGWIGTPTATIVRTADSRAQAILTIEVQTPKDLLPTSVVVRGAGWKKTLDVDHQGVYEVHLPDPPPSPEIVEVRLPDRTFKADPSMLGVRIVFGEAQ